MTTLANLIDGAGAKFRADLENSDRVSDQQWAALANAAINRAWFLAASARPDFQVTSQDFTVASGQTASFTVPSTFYGLIDVVANPDTQNEYSLGPFSWANRKSPGNWGPPPSIFQTGGAQRARMMGNTIYLEPAVNAGATYRLWFCPKPTILTEGDYLPVRVTSNTGELSGTYFATGRGVGKTMTSNAAAPLVLDSVPLGLGDRFVNSDGTTHNDNGIYTLTTEGGGGVQWIATRATDFDSNSEVKLGQTVYVTEGANNGRLFLFIAQFPGGVDDGVINFSVASFNPPLSVTLDSILDPFVELLQVLMCITAVRRDERTPAEWLEERNRREAELTAYFALTKNANNGPAKIVDTDARGPAYWRTW